MEGSIAANVFKISMLCFAKYNARLTPSENADMLPLHRPR
jgi:hypothetical protein